MIDGKITLNTGETIEKNSCGGIIVFLGAVEIIIPENEFAEIITRGLVKR